MNKNYNHVVICGFSGIGKTTAATKENNKGRKFIDLESSNYHYVYTKNGKKEINKEFPKNYIDDLEKRLSEDMSDSIYLLSCHKEVRNELRKRNIKFFIVRPSASGHSEYIRRWIKRNNSLDFIFKMSERFIEMIASCVNDADEYNIPTIVLKDNEYLIDILK